MQRQSFDAAPRSLGPSAQAADVPIVEKPLLRDELIDTVRTLVAA
jgi:hypothetical protein